ncbi:hypothetical protein D9599_26210 [Roseomonas sp. KE2513]|nr:hypothetical protein [Roseomonas sp. KE2513]
MAHEYHTPLPPPPPRRAVLRRHPRRPGRRRHLHRDRPLLRVPGADGAPRAGPLRRPQGGAASRRARPAPSRRRGAFPAVRPHPGGSLAGRERVGDRHGGPVAVWGWLHGLHAVRRRGFMRRHGRDRHEVHPLHLTLRWRLGSFLTTGARMNLSRAQGGRWLAYGNAYQVAERMARRLG